MPILGHLPVSDVDTGAVMRVLGADLAGEDRNRVPAAWPDRGRAGLRDGARMAQPERTRRGGAGILDNLLPARGKVAKVEHHAALPWREIGAFMAKLAEQEGVAALALRFAILTAAQDGRGYWRALGGNRHGRGRLDGASGADEGRPRASGATVRCWRWQCCGEVAQAARPMRT